MPCVDRFFREMALLPNTRTHAFVAERTDYEPVANRGFAGLFGQSGVREGWFKAGGEGGILKRKHFGRY